MNRPKFKDEANIQAAQQEAEERKLKRKQSFKKVGGGEEKLGVSFDETASSGSLPENLVVESAEIETIEDQEGEITKIENIPSESTQKTSQHVIKIITDGTYTGTSVYIGLDKLKLPDITIRISRESGVKIVFIKEESLF